MSTNRLVAARIKELQEQLKQAKEQEVKEVVKFEKQTLTIKESENGCISIYGLRRFPINLYRNEIAKLFDKKTVDALASFLAKTQQSEQQEQA